MFSWCLISVWYLQDILIEYCVRNTNTKNRRTGDNELYIGWEKKKFIEQFDQMWLWEWLSFTIRTVSVFDWNGYPKVSVLLEYEIKICSSRRSARAWAHFSLVLLQFGIYNVQHFKCFIFRHLSQKVHFLNITRRNIRQRWTFLSFHFHNISAERKEWFFLFNHVSACHKQYYEPNEA